MSAFIKTGNTPEEIEDLRASASEGDFWMEGDRLNWVGRPDIMVLALDEAFRERNGARTVARIVRDLIHRPPHERDRELANLERLYPWFRKG